MAIVYFDASAFVKLILAEHGEDMVLALWNGCDAPVSSRLAYAEVCSAIAAAHRNHRLDAVHMLRGMRRWDTFWSLVRPVELTADVGRHAGRLVRAHALRGADGVHLASALAIADADLVVASWDRRLAGGALAEGLRVAPAV
jgi:uncharacterized protein